MLFCHQAGADSLREICNGLSCCLGKLTHLGLQEAPKRSTLAYANLHRPAALFDALFFDTLSSFRAQGVLGHHSKPFRFKNKLLSLDATTISLCLKLFPWAAQFRRAKGGVKVHVLLDHDDYMPSFVRMTDAKTADVKMARPIDLNPGSIVAMDRSYNDFALFGRWSSQGIYFVTRLKQRTRYEVVETRKLPQNRPILADEIIRLSSVKAQRNCPQLLRRIVVWDPDKAREIVLLTNHLDFGATTLSTIYKQRWQIEIFFKTLKQNLRIRTFVGTSENALRIQIWTALITLLLMKWMHYLSRARWSFSNLVSMLRLNLFTYRDLIAWLHQPFRIPPTVPAPVQLQLQLQCLG